MRLHPKRFLGDKEENGETNMPRLPHEPNGLHHLHDSIVALTGYVLCRIVFLKTNGLRHRHNSMWKPTGYVIFMIVSLKLAGDVANLPRGVSAGNTLGNALNRER